MTARRWAALFGTVLLIAAVVGALPKERWIFLWDGYGHHGLFRCTLYSESGGRIRTCIGGVDEVVYEEVRKEDGSVKRSWYVGGVWEYARETTTVSGATDRAFRRHANCWSGGAVGEPEGESACQCGVVPGAPK